MYTDTLPATTSLAHVEWQAEGGRRFGENRVAWRFECPACGYVQTPADFQRHVERPAIFDTAASKCLGAFWHRPRRAFGAAEGDEGPCDYDSRCLININPVTVLMPDGRPRRVFAFAN